jgi:hypothetical protein
MTPEEIVREQAEKLGGGWRMEHGVMPVVVLTTVEAAAVIEKLESRSHVLSQILGVKTSDNAIHHPDDVTYIFPGD